MCGGDGTAMCEEPRVAAECTCTEREVGRCSRPTVRPGRTANDDRDHGDGSDTRPRGRHRRRLVGRAGAAWRTRIRLRDLHERVEERPVVQEELDVRFPERRVEGVGPLGSPTTVARQVAPVAVDEHALEFRDSSSALHRPARDSVTRVNPLARPCRS